jgi:hypothetical protein
MAVPNWVEDFYAMFRWQRFVTASIIKLFYWLAVSIIAIIGLMGAWCGAAIVTTQIVNGLFLIFVSFVGTVIGILVARITAEFVLITFRIQEHLGVLRQRGHYDL